MQKEKEVVKVKCPKCGWITRSRSERVLISCSSCGARIPRVPDNGPRS